MTLKSTLPFSILAALSLFGCGPDRQFSKARTLEKDQKFYQAWEKYQEFAANHPKHEKAPEAIFRAGWVAEKQFHDCYMASTFYDQVVSRFPEADPWAKAAALRSKNCPDYFPLYEKSEWVEVDSDTNGKNARVEIVARALTGNRMLPFEGGCLERTFYAGNKKFQTTEFCYTKSVTELFEFKKGETGLSKSILGWPLELGTKWTTKSSGQLFRYEIVGVNKQVAVAAGTFTDCIQVRSMIDGVPGAKNETYAPNVGRILTTSSTNQGEKRIMELLSYKINESLDFEVSE